MTQHIQAIFEGGVFRPLEPVQLAEHKQVSLSVSEAVAATGEAPDVNGSAGVSLQRESLAKLRSEMDRLPDRAPSDGLGGADHDAILYGKPE